MHRFLSLQWLTSSTSLWPLVSFKESVIYSPSFIRVTLAHLWKFVNRSHKQLRTYIIVWCKDRDFSVTFVADYDSQGWDTICWELEVNVASKWADTSVAALGGAEYATGLTSGPTGPALSSPATHFHQCCVHQPTRGFSWQVTVMGIKRPNCIYLSGKTDNCAMAHGYAILRRRKGVVYVYTTQYQCHTYMKSGTHKCNKVHLNYVKCIV